MMRKCHLNTCPVGVATQDPVLRKKFAGQPEHVVNYLFMVAEDARQIMAELGFRTIDEMVGRVDCLETNAAIQHWKADGLDLTELLTPIQKPHADVGTYCTRTQDHGLELSLDRTKLLDLARPALEDGKPVRAELDIVNTNRTVGTILSHEIAKRWGEDCLPDGTIHFKFTGSAGQSFGAFLAQRRHAGAGRRRQRLRRQRPLGRPAHHLSAGRLQLRAGREHHHRQRRACTARRAARRFSAAAPPSGSPCATAAPTR